MLAMLTCFDAFWVLIIGLIVIWLIKYAQRQEAPPPPTPPPG